MNVSGPSADAEQLTAATDRHGRAAIAFTEWHRDLLLLRVAVHSPGGWKLITLDQRRQPIWSPRIRITRNGSIVVVWLDVANPLRLVRVVIRDRQGHWQQPRTLEAADGLASVDVAPQSAGNAVLAWRDTLGSERRVRVASYTPSGWRLPATVAAALTGVGNLRIERPQARCVEWTIGTNRHTWCQGDVKVMAKPG